MATERLYVDPNGKYQKGYIIGDKTFADPEGKIRVPVGSQTQGDDGQWYQLTDTGGVAIPAEQSFVGRQIAAAQNQPSGGANDYISGIANALAQAKISALENAYSQNVSGLNQQKAELPQTFADARNRTASQYETGRANFNQYAARTGLNSGAAGQAQLAMGTTYQGNLGALQNAEIKANRDIDTQLANLTAAYRSQVAQAQAEGDYTKMTMLYQQYQNDQNVLRQEQQRQQEFDMTMNSNKAKLLASMGDFSGYQQLYGLSPEQTASMTALWQQQNAPKVTYSGGSRGGGGGGGGGTPATGTDIYSAIKMSGLDPYTFLAMYGSKYGITQGEIEGVVGGYDNWNKMMTTGTSAYTITKQKIKAMFNDAALGGFTQGNTTADLLKKSITMIDSAGLSEYETAKLMMELGLA